MPRNLLKTQTAIGSYLSLGAVIFLTVVNGVSGIAQRRYPDHQQDIVDLVELANALGAIAGISATGITLKGRYNAGGVYTPRGIPGKNKEELNGSEGSDGSGNGKA